MAHTIRYLGQAESAQLDVDLMSAEVGYSLDQLMELAGLACAQAVHEAYPVGGMGGKTVLVVCGPGNNGGDGLVAARHLTQFGYRVEVCYPKRGKKELYQNLVKQLQNHGVHIHDTLPELHPSPYGLLLDCIFGFSFEGDIRAPFDHIIQSINASGIPVVSVDIPSGWHVEQGNISGRGITPACLVSLTAPKLCAKLFTGRHFLGGRFVPRTIYNKYNLSLPPYPGSAQIVDITGL